MSEEHQHTPGCGCQNPGMSIGGIKVEQLSDGSWFATAPIKALFGSEVEGEIQGHGPTKEAALEALARDRANLYESLWV